MNILITGASGFIGRQLVPLLLAEGHTLHGITRKPPIPAHADTIGFPKSSPLTWHQVDLADTAAVSACIGTVKPDACIHLAWDTQPGRYLDDVEGNLKLLQHSLHLLRELVRHECSHVLALGSCAEYAITDTDLEESAATAPDTIYAAAKLSLCLLGQQITKNTATRFSWGRLFYLYGPGEHPKRLVPGVIAAMAAGQDFEASHGEQARDYLHVQDVASALQCLVNHRANGVFNICSGVGVQIKDILLTVEKLMHRKGLVKLGALPARAWDPERIVGDNRKLKALGWEPQYNLDNGLRSTIQTLTGTSHP